MIFANNQPIKTTVVTAGDSAFAWGSLMLVASMRRNGMDHPVVVGAMDWPGEMKTRLKALGSVTILELPHDRRCLACQKPRLMTDKCIETEWVCWADSDGLFVGDCSEWLTGDNPDEIVIRKCLPVPMDFNPTNLEIWRQDVTRFCGKALDKSRYSTRVNDPFFVIHRKWKGFLECWQRQMDNVLPPDVEIIMAKGTPYFQTDESVLGSLLCFAPEAPRICETYKANGSADPNRYFVHFAYNPKPWQMWNSYSARWRNEAYSVIDWLVSKKIINENEIPRPFRRSWWPFYRCLSPAAPWIWHFMKLKRRLLKK